MTTENEKTGQQVPPYGDEPFVYTANLSLRESIIWLSDKLDELSNRASCIDRVTSSVRDMASRLRSAELSLGEVSVLHHPNSNLARDSNQCLHLVQLAQCFLKQSGLDRENYPGEGLSEEQKLCIQKKCSQSHE